ncbi:MAG: GntR family transcriptional regulator [Velocimicrobium sp.]
MKITPKINGETAREYVVRTLKQNIISLDLVPGSEVSVYELSEQLGVSRTPCREALLELSKTGIISIYPQKGSKIAYVDFELASEARFLRLAIERAVAEEVCNYATKGDFIKLESNIKLQEYMLENDELTKFLELDNEFHYLLFQISHKERIYDIKDALSIHFDRLRNMILHSVKPQKTVEQHKNILEALRSRDRHLVRVALDEHLYVYSEEEKREIKEKFPDYFE